MATEKILTKEERKTKLISDVYKYFVKDKMTSKYQTRIHNIFQMVNKGQIRSLQQAIDYYNSLKPIQVQTVRRIDRPLTESEWNNR